MKLLNKTCVALKYRFNEGIGSERVKTLKNAIDMFSVHYPRKLFEHEAECTVLIRRTVICVLSARIGEFHCISTKPYATNWQNRTLCLLSG